MQDTQDRTTDSGRWLRLLGREEFARLMGACLDSVLERRRHLAPAEVRALRGETLRSFAGLLATRARRVRAVTKSACLRELERTHAALLRERAQNSSELLGLEQELVRARATAATSVLSSVEEETLARALAADLGCLLGSADPKSEVARVLTREGDRRRTALAALVVRERERIDLLERRIVKLSVAHAEMERALAELARRAELDGGLPSIYRTVQGLGAAELEREAKSTMLARIFEQNLALQHKVLQPVASLHETKVLDPGALRQKSA